MLLVKDALSQCMLLLLHLTYTLVTSISETGKTSKLYRNRVPTVPGVMI